MQTQTLPSKLAPNNIELEQSILGCLLMDESAINVVAPLVRVSDFYLIKHGWIYEAIKNVHLDEKPIDFLTVCSQLECSGKINEVGGAAYITALINAVPSAVHAETYARELANLSGNRRLIQTASEIAGLAYENKDYPQAYSAALDKVLEAAPRIDRACASSADAVTDVLIEFLKHRDEPRDFLGIPTGLIDFDNILLGFQNGLYIIQGKSSHGKTAFALTCAEGIAETNHKRIGKRVLFVSMEMSQQQISERRLAYRCGISTDELKLRKIIETGRAARPFNPFEIERVEQAAMALVDHPFEVAQLFAATSAEIVALITERKARAGVDCVFVDYIQLCQDEVEGTQDVKRLGRAANNLKHCADRLGIPIIVLSQVSRKVDGREIKIAGMGDARGSGEIDENADGLMSVYNPDAENRKTPNYKKTNEVGIFIDKDRLGGAAGKSCLLTFIERTGALVNKAR